MIRRPLCSTLLLLTLAFSSCKKDTDADPDPIEPPPVEQQDISSVDSKVSQWMTQNGMPGLSIAISKNGKLVYRKGYGDADKEGNEKVSAESQFRIASVSKLITSVAVMKLIQDGAITPEQKVFGATGVLGTTYGTQPYKQYVADITIGDLLHHTIGGWGQDSDPAFFDRTLDETALINWTVNNVILTKKPGTVFDYSNFGYMLLARIIEKISGKTYPQFVDDEIWKKVGATQSAMAGTGYANRQPKEARYYGQEGDIPFVYDNMNFSRGDGAFGWVSTPTDLLRFATAVDSSNTRPDILSLPTIKTMVTTTPASLGFGYMPFGCGWVVEAGEWFWWGSLPGTFAMLYRNNNGICLAATANSRKQPTPENGLNSFIAVLNFIAFDNTIAWQDIDQF